MRYTIDSAAPAAVRKLGPVCIACGNKRRFLVDQGGGEESRDVLELPDGEVHVVACGRCHSRNSVVISHID